MDNKEKQKLMILAGIFGIAFLIIYYHLLLKPQFSSFIANNREYGVVKARVKKSQRLIATKNSLENQLLGLKNQEKKFEKTLPNEEEISNLLEDFSKIAKESGVEIIKIQPLEKDNLLLKAKAQKKSYSDFPILIEAVASYHQCVNFISKLENLDRFIEIEGISIKGRTEDYRRHAVNINLKTYIMNN